VAAAGCGALTDAATQALLQAGVRELDVSHTGVSQRGLFVIPTAMRAHSLRCVPHKSSGRLRFKWFNYWTTRQPK
jgi:hypothetical protein